MIGRDLQFIKALKRQEIGNLTYDFRVVLQNNGINSGIIDRLMILEKKYDFLYELYKILNEATSGFHKENRQKIINEFSKTIDFEFNFIDDDKMLKEIFDNFEEYNEICVIDIL